MFDFENAGKWNDYIPLTKKQEIAEGIALGSLARYRTDVQYGDDSLYDPSVYAENVPVRRRYMMGVLLKEYLGVEFSPVDGEEYLMSVDDYDRAAAKHPLNALERRKSDASVRNAVFDLLEDYKTLDRMVSAEIAALCAAKNDVLPRVLDVLAKTASPAALTQLSEMERGLADRANELSGTIQKFRAADEAE